MSHSIPPNSSPQGSSRNYDEWIAVLVALVALGGIFFWILGKDAKPDQQKFASSPVLPVPERSASQDLNLSRVLEDSFARYRGQDLPERVAIPRTSNRNLFQVFSADDRAIANFDSTGVNRPWTFTPFFFTPPDTAQSTENIDSSLTIAPIPTLDPTETEPETVATPQPQASQPETVATPPVPVPLALADVPEDFWAREFIEYTTQNDIIIPYANGTFKPTQPITRAEFAALVETAFIAEKNTSGQPSYKDVDQSYWAEQAIVDVTKTGFMTGYPGEVFNPNVTVPRVQVLVALASGLKLQPPKNPEQILQKTYQDADQIPQWAVEKVAAATQAGIVVNHPKTNTLNPNQPATRAEVSAIIYQALVESEKAEPISSDYIVKPQK